MKLHRDEIYWNYFVPQEDKYCEELLNELAEGLGICRASSNPIEEGSVWSAEVLQARNNYFKRRSLEDIADSIERMCVNCNEKQVEFPLDHRSSFCSNVCRRISNAKRILRWKTENRDHINEYNREYYLENREELLAYLTRKYVGLSKDQKEEMLKTQGNRCGITGLKFVEGAEIHLDHIIPYSRGGSNELENLRLVYGVANRVKGENVRLEREIVEYMRSRIFEEHPELRP